MSEQNNLWEILKYEDLMFFLRDSNDKIVVLSLVHTTTKDEYKSMMKKYIKLKSRKYPNILFLYYTVRPADMNKKFSLIEKENLSRYPKMCHIFNRDTILAEMHSIHSVDLLDDLFSNVEDEYDNLLLNYLNSNKQIDQNQPDNLPEKIEFDEEKEKKKFIEKVKLLKDKVDEYNINFMEDTKQRKEEEEEIDENNEHDKKDEVVIKNHRKNKNKNKN